MNQRTLTHRRGVILHVSSLVECSKAVCLQVANVLENPLVAGVLAVCFHHRCVWKWLHLVHINRGIVDLRPFVQAVRHNLSFGAVCLRPTPRPHPPSPVSSRAQAVMERRSESPADSIDMTPTRKSLPAAVPRATLEPW